MRDELVKRATEYIHNYEVAEANSFWNGEHVEHPIAQMSKPGLMTDFHLTESAPILAVLRELRDAVKVSIDMSWMYQG